MSPATRPRMANEVDPPGAKHGLTPLIRNGAVAFWQSEHICANLKATIAMFRSPEICTLVQARKFRGIAGFAAMAEFG